MAAPRPFKLVGNPVVTPLCDCGQPGAFKCGEGLVLEGLQPCPKPSCKQGGWCEHHRHAIGTMGYGVVNAVGRATAFAGFRGTDNLWDKLTAWWWTNVKSSEWQANKMLENHKLLYAPPAPIPPFELAFADGQRWKSTADLSRMERVP
jgi:hypothetical protein